jgi:CRISPR-associated endonuclease/helicase Cas3
MIGAAVRFEDLFKLGSSGKKPRPYQIRLAEDPWPETLVVPTGFGKTAAALSAWLWKLARGDVGTPRRLVYCLPMRTLVEQTESVAKIWIDVARTALGIEVGFDVLMGGRSDGHRGLPGWMLNPEHPAILIGTQDMLVSAALMRGYGVTRYRWPVDFALLHNDVLWVFDEVQLTGATLATSAQLEAFRRRFGLARDCRTLWMSATLDPAWLKTVDFAPADAYRPHDLSDADLAEAQHLWTAVKTLQTLDLSHHDVGKKDGLESYAAALAEKARELAKAGTNTILFLNTVARAQAVHGALRRGDGASASLLVHSRFRAADRESLTDRLRTDAPSEGRIVVATQALEAGVDVSSSTMITEVAPWSSLVQRFGRCNRYGECGESGADVFWIDLPDVEAAWKPYTSTDLQDARLKLVDLSACGPAELSTMPPSAPARGAVIRKRDLFDLFDTDPDLSGFDIDVSPYVRDADDTDVRLFWRTVAGAAPRADESAPARDELCPAPIGGAKHLLARKDTRAWRWDPLFRDWRRVGKDEVYPGMTLWVDAASGGYDSETGFDPVGKGVVQPVRGLSSEEADRAIDNDEDTRSNVRMSLAKHSVHVRDEAQCLAKLLQLNERERDLIVEAGLWHDLGKAHEAFKARCGLASEEQPLAKTPDYDWRRQDERNRRYFRHELASALAFLADRKWAEQASLSAYLIVAHHGKIRMRLRALPQEPPVEGGKLFARGVWDGDALPDTDLGAVIAPATTLDLDIMQLGEGPRGPSWSARTQHLLNDLGPFRLAWLEALLRIADWRASAAEEAAGYDDV